MKIYDPPVYSLERLRDGVRVASMLSPYTGRANLAIYRPGFRADAFPGLPSSEKFWQVVFWWPGKETVLISLPPGPRLLRRAIRAFLDYVRAHGWPEPAGARAAIAIWT